MGYLIRWADVIILPDGRRSNMQIYHGDEKEARKYAEEKAKENKTTVEEILK